MDYYSKLTKAQQRLIDAMAIGGHLHPPVHWDQTSYRLFPVGCKASFAGKLVRRSTVQPLIDNGVIEFERANHSLRYDNPKAWDRYELTKQ